MKILQILLAILLAGSQINMIYAEEDTGESESFVENNEETEFGEIEDIQYEDIENDEIIVEEDNSLETQSEQMKEESESAADEEEMSISDISDEDPLYVRGQRQMNEAYTIDSSYLDSANLTHHTKFNGYSRYAGVDVSQFQSTIDWKKVKAAGIDFAIIRLGFRGYRSGTLNDDTMFETNIKNAIAAGLKVGVYFFSEAVNTTEAIEEANYVLQRISTYDITMPIFTDVEWIGDGTDRMYTANLSRQQMTDNVLAFCKTIKAAGYQAGVYSNQAFLEDEMYAGRVSSSYHVWVANWKSSTTYEGTYTYWQYNASASVNGISTVVDTNVWYVNDQVKNPFTDVSKSGFYYDAVMWAYQKNITRGTSTTKFSPNQNVTRAQVVTMLWRAAGSPEPKTTSNPFKDVSKTSVFYKAILWAYQNGITSGTTSTTFSPNQACTRAQIVTFLHRYAGKPSADINMSFKDVKTSSVFYSAIRWAYQNGVTSGTTATTFEPNRKCTRASAVVFLYRYLF